MCPRVQGDVSPGTGRCVPGYREMCPRVQADVCVPGYRDISKNKQIFEGCTVASY